MTRITEQRVQVELHSGARRLVCWTEPRVKVGDRLTLKNHREPTTWWDVAWVSQPVSVGSINRGWENNI